MARKPRSPRSPRSLSLEKDSVQASPIPADSDKANRDSVPTADLSAEDSVVMLSDDSNRQSVDVSVHENGIVRDIFSASSNVQEEEEEEKDSLLARVSKRAKKKQIDADDEVSLMREQHRLSRRRLWLVRIVIAIVVLVLVIAGVYAAFFSPLFLLSRADVEISAPADSSINEGDIRTVLDKYEGVSLLRLSPTGIEDDIETAVAGTDKVDVTRAFPHGLSISYSLKEPSACLVRGKACEPIDETGRAIPKTDSTDIDSLLHIAYAGRSHDVSDVMESVQGVLGSLDDATRSAVARFEINKDEDIRLVLKDGRIVVWGQSVDNETKARVLPILLSDPAVVYDISAPEAPVTRNSSP